MRGKCSVVLKWFFFKKLLDLHKPSGKLCDTCTTNGETISEELDSQHLSTNEIFLHYKKFCSFSQLYRSFPSFTSFVKLTIQVCLYSIENFFYIPGIGEMITKSILNYNESFPKICSPELLEKLISLIVRTILFKHIQWLNLKMKQKKWKYESLSRKLSILTHQ